MQQDFLNAVLNHLPLEKLDAILHAVQAEVARRQPVHRESTYEALVNRYGLDGNAQLNLSNAGHEEIIPGPPAYLLSDLPFDASFDNDLNAFVYSPKGEQLRELKLAFTGSLVHPDILALVDDNLEILIEPTLIQTSPVRLYNPVIGRYVQVNETLAEIVTWYTKSTEINFHDIPYVGGFYKATAEQTSLLAFGGHDMVTEVEWKGRKFKTAPFKTGSTVNVQVCSNIPQLIEEGVVPVTTHLEKHPIVKSVFVEVGGALIRVLTGRLPYSRFVQSHVAGDRGTRLDLRAAVNITRDMKDCFGNVIPWTGALGDDGLDLEVGLHGTFYNETGNLSMGAGVVNFTAHDTIGEVLHPLLKPTAKVRAYDIDSALLER